MTSILKGQGSKNHLILFVADPDELAWDIEVDVLVVGAGGCGLIAALAAAEFEVHVFIVEKEKACQKTDLLI